MSVGRPGWDFAYEPARRTVSASDVDLDVVVATSSDVGPAALEKALRGIGPELHVEPLIARSPLFWTRVRAKVGATPEDVLSSLTRLPVRYVAPARHESMDLAPPLPFAGARRAGLAAKGTAWAVRRIARSHDEPATDGRWFLRGDAGIAVDRAVCGTGTGMRLAVIDDEAADIEYLELDALRCIGIDRPPATTGHAALMVAWATGARSRDGGRFVGVAPDASTRLYCIPKPGIEVVSLPLAIVQAVFDGADVVVCATYVEGTTSPLLDDALEVAAHLGRRGRGTAVVLPTGRETVSPGNSIHASLSLHLGDPASDPRVHCIAPGGRDGGWFLWRNARGKVRPFANRGPAVRWMAPGDDVAYPFSSRDRLFHAESSGAAAVAAGIMLLVMSSNPCLRLPELHGILARTAAPPRRGSLDTSLADPADVLPLGFDGDGHNAKSGYGRLNAARACACAKDPVSLELVAMGEDALAFSWCTRRRPYSRRLARWAVRAALARADLAHALRAILRHERLVSARASREAAHAHGALARQLALLARELLQERPPALVRQELSRALAALTASVGGAAPAALEKAIHDGFADLCSAGRTERSSAVLPSEIPS